MNQRHAAAMTAEPGTPVPPEPPRSVMIAVRLMYAGAALTAIGLVIGVIGVATGEEALRASHRHATLAQLHATQSFLIAVSVISGVIEIGAWLLMARANRSGLKWARIAATVLFALGTWNLISHIIGTATVTNLAYTALMWLVGLGAVFFLWRKDSSAYFT
ncbi:MAG TPA: hypothetical protein VF983_07940 [Streptosporangiaceae bacterium]